MCIHSHYIHLKHLTYICNHCIWKKSILILFIIQYWVTLFGGHIFLNSKRFIAKEPIVTNHNRFLDESNTFNILKK